MYRAMLAEVNEDQVYVAIGPNPYIKAGYVANKTSLFGFLSAVRDAALEGQDFFELFRELPFVLYWQGHLSTNKWTAIVAILLASIFVYGNIEDEEHLEMIGDVYNNAHHNVTRVMKSLVPKVEV